jgi:uncharacterized protein
VKIDVFPHILPPRFYSQFHEAIESEVHKQLHEYIPSLYNLDARFRVMDKFGDYSQVLTLASPPLENIRDSKKATQLAMAANDEMAELYLKYPDRFVAFAACLPLQDMDAALREADRAVKQLNARGVQIFTPINDKPLDLPEFFPLYEKMYSFNLPIWIHPQREFDYPDYRTEKFSKFNIFSMLGWVYETSSAMVRLVGSGVLEKYPGLKFITHHAGAMIPFLENRINGFLDSTEIVLRRKTVDLKKPALDYLKLFYADTAIYGNTAGLECSLSFFGADNLLFGSDMPYDPQYGLQLIRETIRSIEEMEISASDRKKIFEGNTRKLLRLAV